VLWSHLLNSHFLQAGSSDVVPSILATCLKTPCPIETLLGASSSGSSPYCFLSTWGSFWARAMVCADYEVMEVWACILPLCNLGQVTQPPSATVSLHMCPPTSARLSGACHQTESFWHGLEPGCPLVTYSMCKMETRWLQKSHTSVSSARLLWSLMWF
jgi:hypothetical protein